MRFKFFLTAFVMMAAYLCSSADANPITYTLIGTMSGDLDFHHFDNAVFVWFMTGDTDQRQMMGDGFFGVPAQSVTFEIGKGVGPLTPVDPLFAVSGAPNFPTFGFTDITETSGIGFNAPELATYDGVSSLNPISVALNGTFLLTTLQGTLFIESLTGTMFDAVVVPDVPEPLTLTLVGAGLAGIGAIRRRRRYRIRSKTAA